MLLVGFSEGLRGVREKLTFYGKIVCMTKWAVLGGGGVCESAYGEFLPLRPQEEMTIGVRIGMIERLARHFLNQQYCRSNPTGFVV